MNVIKPDKSNIKENKPNHEKPPNNEFKHDVSQNLQFKVNPDEEDAYNILMSLQIISSGNKNNSISPEKFHKEINNLDN